MSIKPTKVSVTEKFKSRHRVASLISGGFIGVSFIIIQSLISSPRDIPGFIALIAFAISLPVLAGQIILWQFNLNDNYYFRSKWSPVIRLFYIISVINSFVGVAAFFWHISWIAGLLFVIVALVYCVIASLALNPEQFNQKKQELLRKRQVLQLKKQERKVNS